MALGKVRTSKRAASTSTSYASTITTAVFIAVCVLGVWMLTTNSVVPPQTTTRTATATAGADLRTSATTNPNKDTQSFEDTQGDLPDDALKSDEPRGAAAAEQQQPKSGSTTKKYSTADVETATTDQRSDGRESAQEAAVDETTRGKESIAEEEEKQQQTESAAQVSEERTVTQKERDEETTRNKEQRKDPIQDNDSSSSSTTTTTTDNADDENQRTDRNHQSDEPKAEEESKTGGYNADNDGDNSRGDKSKEHEVGQEEVLSRQDKDDGSAEGQQEESSSSSSASAGQEATTNEDDKAQQNTSDETQQAQTTDDAVDKAQVEDESTESKQSPMQEPKPEDTSEKPAESTTFPGGENSGIPKESTESKKSWKTQKDQSENQKERRKDDSKGTDGSIYGYTWQLCNVTAGGDYIPCLDNERAIAKLHSRGHYEHRERHCPEEGPTCLVPLPEGYKTPIQWPTSRDKIWYHNVPHTLLAEVKGHQNWVKVTGEFLTFPGGGTQFIHGALHYIDFLQSTVRGLAWGKHTRVILDVGCGVASFGGFLFERGVLAMSFAPKDEHEAQVQFALERGIPAISAVMGTQRLPFPSRVYDLVHCARCRVPWHVEGGMLLLELNRVLRPGGFFVWSATPVYQKLQEDVEIWKEMSALTKSMCWEIVAIQRDKLNSIGAAIYRKPTTNHCYDQRKHKRPPMCKADDDANAAWYVPLQACMHRAPVESTERGTTWPDEWPRRLHTTPYWLNSSQMGIYGKPAPKDFATDYEHWNRVVNKLYLNGLGISWSNVRNVMDMRAVYGGFASAMKDLKVWVMNVVNVDSPDTLPIIFERGLFGIYHDWCESFSTYPRTYDLLHADHLFSRLTKRCKLAPVMAEIDRIARPGGKLIVRDESGTIGEVENLLKSLHWEVHLTFSKDKEGMLSAQKSDWRPTDFAASS